MKVLNKTWSYNKHAINHNQLRTEAMHSPTGTTSNNQNPMQEEPLMGLGLTRWNPTKRLKHEFIFHPQFEANSMNLQNQTKTSFKLCLHKW